MARWLLPLTVASAVLPFVVHGQVLFSEDFDTDHTANWTVNASAGTHPVNVFFDYSTIGIPSAPNAGGTTRGLKLQANTVGNVLGGVSVSPIGQSFTGNYRLHFELWMNFNGPLNGGGNGTTQFGGAGVGVTGATAQWSGAAALEGVWFAWTGEGGTTADYRAYSAISNNYVPASGVYAAGTSTTPVDVRNASHSYYSGFGGKTAPAAQLAAYAQQAGSTPVGTLGFTWLDVTVTKSGNLITWAVNGTAFATVNATAIPLSTNILFNFFDLNATTSTDPNAPALLFALVDNVRVEVVPAVYAVTGGGADCSGVEVGLSGSEVGVEYRLSTNGIFSGITVAGTGSAISFGTLTKSGLCSVIASNVLSTAKLAMNGTATVTINQAPAITSGPTPASVTKSVGESVSFSITASGAGLAYQWQRDGTNLVNGGNISGVTSPTLMINPAQPVDSVGVGHGYTCVVNGLCAPGAVSGEALLNVIPLNRWKGDGAANQWDFVTGNWFDGLFSDGVTTVFDDAGSNNVPVNLTTTVNPGPILVASTGLYAFTGSGSIAGSASLTKTNTGVLSIANSNSFTGSTLVLDGVIALQHDHALGATSGSTTVSNQGTLRIEGNGLIIAEPLNSFAPVAFDLLGFPTNSLLNNLANTNTWSGPITLGYAGENAPIKSSSELLILDSPTPIAGPGTLLLTGDGATLVRSSLAPSVPFIEAYGPGERYFFGDTYSTASVGIYGNGTVVITNGHVFDSSAFGVNCNSGALEVRGTSGMGAPLKLWGGGLRVSGGTVTFSRPLYPKFNSDYTSFLETVAASDQIVFNTAVQDDFGHAYGSTIISGPGVVVLNAGDTGPNRYLGYWQVMSGSLKLNHPSALGREIVYLFNSRLETGVDGGGAFSSSCGLYGDATIEVGRQTLGGGVSNYFGYLLFSSEGKLTVRPGDNLIPGSTANAGFGIVDLLSTNGLFTVQTQGGVGCIVTLLGEVRDGADPQSLVKDGAGELVLRAGNTYRGGTVISNGTLVVANTVGSATGSGVVTVFGGGTLAGNGRIASSVIVKSGGTLAAGASIGALVISNSLVFEAGATNLVEVNLAAGTNDFVYGLTNVVYAGTLVVSNVGPQGFTNGAVFQIVDSIVYSGAFDNFLPATPGVGLAWDVSTLTTDGTLRVISANQPPVVANLIPDQTNIYGGAFAFTFAANTFNDPDAGQTLSYSANGLPPGISFDGPTRTFSGTTTNVGSSAITVTATDDGSPQLSAHDVFDLVVEKAPLLATADDQVRGYGAANPPLTVSYSGFVLGETEAVLGIPPVTGTVADPASPVGNYPIALTGGSDLHYSLTLSNGTLTVTNAPLVVSANNTNRPYGQPNPDLTGSVSGIMNGDNISATFASTATPESLPGDYSITAAIDDPDTKLGNYLVLSQDGTLTVVCVTNLTVTTTADAGLGSLRDSVAAICAGGVIDFAVGGTITLTSEQLALNQSVTIAGPGATNLTLSGANTWRVFNVTTGAVHISGLTIADGNDSADFLVGAGIRNNAQLSLTECVFSNNVSEAAGGAILNRPEGSLVVERCLFVNNRARGDFQGGGTSGGIGNQGVMYLTNSTFSGNSAGFSAGVIRNTGGMVIESCTFTANTASECTNCLGTPSVVAHLGTNAVVHNSIFGGNTNVLGVFRDLTGVMDSSDFNLIEFASGYTGTGTNDLLGTAPLLAPLADNGGATWTHLPLPASPVIDAADPLSLIAVDQRGVNRPVNGRADIGAAEAPALVTPPTLSIRPGVGDVTISWTPPTLGFILQTNLTLNPLTWGNAPSGGTNPTTLLLETGTRFFRLLKP